ncbi:metallophosphoesterase [Marinobacterium arenosum]|uniref:metallophosphoesterase n=1 Tax=Marinobacterium arenosum TaxID=2862496 RepID=UPI001C96FEC1|nr:metallophosphoesterase [Marinobacterium arenosum]MBY4675116.1 metallophosphoesterase [Marinobacterium arenosum]
MLQRFERNKRGHDFAVGDLHGHFTLLLRKLRQIGFNPDADRLFSVGDLIDRGPDSMKCMGMMFEPWFWAVRGNHEEMMFDALLRDGSIDLWLWNGGGWMAKENMEELKALAQMLDKWLPCAIELESAAGHVGIVHAEVPGDDWAGVEAGDIKTMTWARRRVSERRCNPVRGIDAVICGHTPVSEPMRLGNVNYIDTGAFTTGHLTIIDLADLCEVRAAA